MHGFSSPANGTCSIYQLNTAALYAVLKPTQKSVSSKEGKRGTVSSMDAALDSREQSGCAGRSRQSPNSFSNCNPQHSEKRVLANALVNADLHGAWDIKEHFARASLSSWAFVRPAARMLPFPCLHFYVLSQQPNQTQLLALLLHIQKRLGLPPPSLKTLLSNTSWQLTQGLCVARAKLLLMALATQCCGVLRCRRQGFGRAVISKKTHLFFYLFLREVMHPEPAALRSLRCLSI